MKFLKLSLATSFMVAANLASAAVLHDLPFKGEDFSDAQKLFTKDHAETQTQKYGYDIGARRFDSSRGVWTSLLGSLTDYEANPTNNKYIIYKKPVYAMRDGKIIACWRNAPENPRPKISTDTDTGKQWLHPKYKEGLIPGGGNMLIVEHNDGTRMLYAHMTPGSISSTLCPKSATTYSRKPDTTKGEDAMDEEFTGLTPGQQVTVTKGQLLGLVGNSGSSTGPHLHIHLTKNNYAEEIYFRKGISSPVDNSLPNGTWTSFAGGKIPSGQRLLWAPRTLSSTYVRHAFAEPGFKGLFAHLTDSGFKPSWLDAYKVGNATYYNMVWKPADVQWRAVYGLSSSAYNTAFAKAINDGFAPVHVDSHQVGSGAAYTAIFEKRSGSFLARHNLTEAQHSQVFEEAKQKNLRPKAASVISVDGQRRYTVLYRSDNIGGYVFQTKIPSADYQSFFDAQKAAGRKPLYLNSYYHDGQVYFTGIFSTVPSSPMAASHNITGATFQTLFDDYKKSGYLPSIVAGIDGYPSHRFAAVWRK